MPLQSFHFSRLQFPVLAGPKLFSGEPCKGNPGKVIHRMADSLAHPVYLPIFTLEYREFYPGIPAFLAPDEELGLSGLFAGFKRHAASQRVERFDL